MWPCQIIGLEKEERFFDGIQNELTLRNIERFGFLHVNVSNDDLGGLRNDNRK